MDFKPIMNEPEYDFLRTPPAGRTDHAAGRQRQLRMKRH